LAAPVLGADATYRVVARTGQFAPGGGFFSSFGAPVISANGRVAFKASVVGVLANRGVWSEGISGMNNLESVIRRGDEIPGAGGTFVDSIILDDGGVIINDSGELAFGVPITGTQDQFGDHAILIHNAMGLDSVAVPGQLVSLPCGGFGCQRWLTDISENFFAFNNAGQVVFQSFIAGTAVNEDNEHLLILSDGTSSEVVIREGDVPPGTFGVVYSSMMNSLPQLNDNGEILMRIYLRDVNINDSYWSVWRGAPGALSIVAAENWTAPMGGEYINGFIGLGEYGFNNAGQALFTQYVENNLGDQRIGLWLNSNAPTQTVCFEGLPAPLGLTYDYPGSYAGSINASGAIAFTGLVEGPGVNVDNNTILVRRTPFGLQTVLAREGMQAPGLLNGVHFNTVGWSGEQILDDGRVVFRAGLAGPGVHAGNDDSLWITRDGAPPALLIREAQTMVIGGQLKTVYDFTSWLSPGSESGRGTSVSELGQAAMRVLFTDGTEAILVASPESVCPGDVNGDGLIDFADLNAMLSEFGHLGDVVDADLDLDGDVDFTDLNAVLSNFGVNCN
jgi:hypothetical protein